MKPPTYQTARFTDYFEDYISKEQKECEKYSTYAYYQKRIMHTNKAVLLWPKFAKWRQDILTSELARLEAVKQEESFDRVKEAWLCDHEEVI